MPIKPIPGCISLQGDITSDKCRSDLRKELQNWKADLVLHDGAPNVGKNWLHDAYQQALLTLHAFKLATEFLVKGGTFVTKIFRSKDYQSLMWVFNQFFKNVHATKPAASRNESAEIFVVCLNYKAPEKIDPKFLDPKHVFSEVEPENTKANELVNPERIKKKAPAEGYDAVSLLYKKANASEFIMEDKPIHVLNNCHEIILDEDRIKNHAKTTAEIVECCKDIRVLGMKELRLLKKWREILRTDFQKEIGAKKAEKSDKDPDEKNEDEDEESDEDLQELNKEIKDLKEEEKKVDKRKKKRALKEKRKIAQRIDMKMIIPGDEGPTKQEEGLFKITDVKTKKDLAKIIDQAPDTLASDSDDDPEDQMPKKKAVKYSKEDKNHIDALDQPQESESDEDSGKEDLDLEASESEEDEILEEEDDEPEEENPLLVSMDDTKETNKERKANLWFDKDIFKGIDEDEDLEEADVQGAIDSIKKKGGKMVEKPAEKPAKKREYNSDNSDSDSSEDDNNDDDDDSDSDSDSEAEHQQHNVKLNDAKKDGFEIVSSKKRKKLILTPEELALGQEMIKSKKSRRDIMDSGWNRYMFDDKDQDLPDWFVKEEELHMRLHPDTDPEVVQFYKDRMKDVNVKTIKKVVEAKARKKRRLVKRMDKAKKRASVILENADLGTREKASEIKKLYKKAASGLKKKEVEYVVAKKHSAARRAKRPAGVKGPYKQVDPRMKKDTQGKRKNANAKRMQKRKLKGKKTRPERQPQKN